jgi:hypothetical protein
MGEEGEKEQTQAWARQDRWWWVVRVRACVRAVRASAGGGRGGGRLLARAAAHFDMESTNFDCFASPSPVS